MSVWAKTPRGWVLRNLHPCEVNHDTLKLNAKRTVNDRDVSQGRVVRVTGSKGQQKMSVCVSQFIENINMLGAVDDMRRKEYLFDVMFLFMTKSLNKVSGAAQRQLFKILEHLVNEALESQAFIIRMKELLIATLQTMTGATIQIGRVGSNTLWNRHIQTVTNLCTKVDRFQPPERKDDGLPCFMDLPKEVIREIVLKLTDHRDIIHLGQTCRDMYYIVEDSSIWAKLVQYHFNEKQIDTFIEATDCIYLWQSLHEKCYKKYGLRKQYVDQLVICSACKTLHWMMLGHHCWVADEQSNTDAWLEPVSPDQLFAILFLN